MAGKSKPDYESLIKNIKSSLVHTIHTDRIYTTTEIDNASYENHVRYYIEFSLNTNHVQCYSDFSDHRMMRDIAERFFHGCQVLSSSVHRKSLSAVIRQAKQGLDQYKESHRENIVETLTKYRDEKREKYQRHIIQGVVRRASESVDNLLEKLSEYQSKNLDLEEIEDRIWKFIALHHSEADVVDLYRKATIQLVMKS